MDLWKTQKDCPAKGLNSLGYFNVYGFFFRFSKSKKIRSEQ